MGDSERDRFYSLLDEVADGPRLLPDCQAVPEAPGVYFFFEQGEVRRSGRPRVVRVGKSAKLRTRLLNQHLNGTHRDDCSDDHGLRSSVFRHHVGLALIVRQLSQRQDTLEEGPKTWSRLKKSEPSNEVERDFEQHVERRVTQVLRAMSVRWVVTTTDPARIEKHLIGLLSSADSPSTAWLGSWHSHEKIRGSGLWNIEHVGGNYDSDTIRLLGG